MKHNFKITAILLGMFVLTQFIGLYVVDYYSPIKVIDGNAVNVSSPDLPFDMNPPKVESSAEYYGLFFWILIAFVFAIVIMFLLTKFEWAIILKLWFFVVVIIALSISFFVLTNKLGIEKTFLEIPLIAVGVALPLAFIKIYKKEFLIHNLTELFIYPGIAAVFVPILSIPTIIILLILISIYDMWAVWKSGLMQKMVKYQMDKLNILAGFFIPHADKKTKQKIKLIREKYKGKKIPEKIIQKKFKINVAILGGGDVIFPIITAGVVLKTWGLAPALLVTAGATLGLGYLFFISEKKKFYPAMPFITAGIFIGMILGWIIF